MSAQQLVFVHNLLLFRLQFECGAAAVPDLTGGSGVGGRRRIEEAAGRAEDVSDIKMLVSAACLPSVSPVSLQCLTNVTRKKKRKEVFKKSVRAHASTRFLIRALHTVCTQPTEIALPLKSTWNCIPRALSSVCVRVRHMLVQQRNQILSSVIFFSSLKFISTWQRNEMSLVSLYIISCAVLTNFIHDSTSQVSNSVVYFTMSIFFLGGGLNHTAGGHFSPLITFSLTAPSLLPERLKYLTVMQNNEEGHRLRKLMFRLNH